MKEWHAALLALALALPPLDPWFDERMARHMALQFPLLALTGFIAGRRWRDRAESVDPHGLGALLFLGGALMFWMLPRSIDRAVADWRTDQLLHMSLFLGGLVLSARWPRVPYAARGAAAIMLIAMLIAVGSFYYEARMLLCSRYTLPMQAEAGAALLRLALAASPFILVGLARSLVRGIPLRQADPSANGG